MKPYTCPPQLSDVATLHWEIQKRHLSTLLFIYFRLFTLAQKKTSSNCCSAALAVYLLLFSASYYLHSPIALRLGHATGHVAAFGSSLLWRGLNFSTAWYTTRLNGVEEAWKHILMQKVVTLNTSYDIACLTFQLPYITMGSFQSHWRQPTTGSPTSERTRNKPSVRWKSFKIHKLV